MCIMEEMSGMSEQGVNNWQMNKHFCKTFVKNWKQEFYQPGITAYLFILFSNINH